MTDPVRTIEKRVRIAASPSTVWSFWTDARRLVEWWGSSAEIEAEPGGTFRVAMGEDGPVMRGSFVELQPPTRLVFSFGWEANPPGTELSPGTTTVEVTLTPAGDGTELVLRHSELPTSRAHEHAEGWDLFVGERLPAVVEAAGAR